MNELFENGSILSTPSNAQVSWAIAIGFFFLALAVSIELYRRHKERKARLEAEWRAVEEIVREKELSDKEKDLLFAAIRRYAPVHPLRAVTLRESFNSWIEKEITQTQKKGLLKAQEEYGLVLREIRIRLGLDYIPFGQRIHSTRELYHGQAIWIAAEEGVNPEWFRMSVVNVDEAFFHLAPHLPKAQVPFQAGETIRCRMWREEDARYVFSARLLEKSESPTLWLMDHCLDLKRQQSRAHFRIHYDQDSTIQVLNAPVDDDYSDVHQRETVTTLRGRITSLSGGGFAAIVHQAVPKEILLRIQLELDTEEQAFEAVARLVGTSPLSSGQQLLRAAFVAMDDEVRDKITHYVFKQQQPKLAGAAHPPKE